MLSGGVPGLGLLREHQQPDPSRAVAAVLMCAPRYYGIRYSINPWMDTERDAIKQSARAQWEVLAAAYRARGLEVQLIEQHPAQPDMVFTANAGLVCDHRVVLSHFAYPERQGEEAFFAAWFLERGYSVVTQSDPFEGAGDAFVFQGRLLGGYGWRSTRRGVEAAAESVGLPCVALRLIDPRFYHLDTCLSPLDDETILWYPSALDVAAQRAVRSFDARLIEVTDAEALEFACNAMTIGREVYTSSGSIRLTQALAAEGFNLRPLCLDEFLKSGGGARCLTLPLPAH